ncbi:phosphatase PAP2 family protein [Bacillus sp. CGMCC 1.16607]|uniref:phosphatase PAP2 family protein n=1 Tax=Bacillus sp. CGMCC 1.16607 TaxID=3351842 RepID=UPI00362A9027
MNIKYQFAIAFFISVIALLAFSLLAFMIKANTIVSFDSTIITFIQSFESTTLTSIMKVFTYIGSTRFTIGLAIAVLLFLYFVLKHRIELILFIVGIIGSAILNKGLKYLFHRARPDLHRLIEISGFSFPSGHSMNAFTVYTLISFLLWRHISSKLGRVLLILISTMMVLLIGISRIYLGVHFPSDVIGGYLASGCWLAIAIWFFQRYQDRRGRREKERVRSI